MNHPWSFCFSHISHAIYHRIILALLSKYIYNLTSFLHLHCYSLISPSSHTWNTGETFKEDSSFYLSSMNHSQHHHWNNPLKAPVRKVSLMLSDLFHLEQSLPSSQMLTWPCMTANTPTSFPLYRISYYSFFPLSAPFTLAPLLTLNVGTHQAFALPLISATQYKHSLALPNNFFRKDHIIFGCLISSQPHSLLRVITSCKNLEQESIITSSYIQSNGDVSMLNTLIRLQPSLYPKTHTTVNLISCMMENSSKSSDSLMATCRSCLMGEDSVSNVYSYLSQRNGLVYLWQNKTVSIALKIYCLPFVIFIMS